MSTTPVVEKAPVVEAAIASAIVEAEPVVVEAEEPKAAKKNPDGKEEESPLNKGIKVDVPSTLGLFVQYKGGEVGMEAIVEAAKEDFKAANGRVKLTSLKLYVKPEERTAYYVANDSIQGKVVLEF